MAVCIKVNNVIESFISQCNQMARLNFIIWPLTTIQICQKMIKTAKVGLKFCQTENKPSKFCLGVFKVCPSGVISPNLVTLPVISCLKIDHESGSDGN